MRFRDQISHSNITSGDDFGINSAESQLFSGGRIYDLESWITKSLTERAAAIVGLFGNLDDALADTQQLTGLQVFSTEIEIHKKIISGQFPSSLVARHQIDHTGIHDTDLDVGIRASIRKLQPTASRPCIALGSTFRAETTFLQAESFFMTRTNDDCSERAEILRRFQDLGKAVHDFLFRQVSELIHQRTFLRAINFLFLNVRGMGRSPC